MEHSTNPADYAYDVDDGYDGDDDAPDMQSRVLAAAIAVGAEHMVIINPVFDLAY
jgi:hypothetical protein